MGLYLAASLGSVLLIVLILCFIVFTVITVTLVKHNTKVRKELRQVRETTERPSTSNADYENIELNEQVQQASPTISTSENVAYVQVTAQ